MNDMDIMTRCSVVLRPDPSRTVIRPFDPGDPEAFVVPGHPRAERIADRIRALDAAQMDVALEWVRNSLSERHRDVETMLIRRFDDMRGSIGDCADFSDGCKLLIGAYFSEEYSFEAAALFNPSMVLHPRQEDVDDGAVRFAMSLRGIGEGHVSSVTFRTGSWKPGGDVIVDVPSPWSIPPRIEQAEEQDNEGVIHLRCDGSREVSESVLFPVASRQKQGIEDLRLVRFVEDDGSVRYLGTFTAFSGAEVRQELLHVEDFRNFAMRPLKGPIAHAKGMALFPRKVGGRYAMLARHDNENIWLMTSPSLHEWHDGTKIVAPHYPWEFIQMGNCGSPIEIEEGWLVLTHGVGMVRNYCIGACLLDREDPSRVLARTPAPILAPSPDDRDGYVPNVVYSCGGLVHDRTLLLPYGAADNYAAFATVGIDTLLAAMC